jgi:putative drug exporter of the RND superfamily
VNTTNDNSFTLPGTGSGTAQQLLLRSAPGRAGDSDQIVWRVSHGSVTHPAIEQRMSAMLARVSHLPEVASVTSPYLPGGKVQVSGDGRTAYATVNFATAADDLEKADINRVVAMAIAPVSRALRSSLAGRPSRIPSRRRCRARRRSASARPPSSCSSRSGRCWRWRCRS